jgi:hypothetical protein
MPLHKRCTFIEPYSQTRTDEANQGTIRVLDLQSIIQARDDIVTSG